MLMLREGVVITTNNHHGSRRLLISTVAMVSYEKCINYTFNWLPVELLAIALLGYT